MFNKQPSDPNTPSKVTTNVPSGTTIVIIIVVIAVALFLVLRVFNPTGGEPVPQATDLPFSQGGSLDDQGVALGGLVAARSIDSDGCPVSQTSNFNPNEAIYVVAPNSAVEAGTTLFVRLYREDQPLEDAPAITANQNYQNTCINFVFEPESANFQSGRYEAEVFVNGNSAGSIQFDVN